MEVAAVIDRLVFGDNNQGGWCQAHSGSTSKELIASSRRPLVFLCWWTMADRRNRALCLWWSAQRRGEENRRGEDGGRLWKRRKKEKRQGEEKDGNRPSHAVIFTCDFWQQSSKDKMFHCKSGYILLCTLNIQVFGVEVVLLQEEKVKKAVACLYLTELSWRILVEFQNPDLWNTESYRKLWSPSSVFKSSCRKLTCKQSKWTVTLIMEVLTQVVKSFKCFFLFKCQFL